jgi:glucan-binding YG repeat protein
MNRKKLEEMSRKIEENSKKMRQHEKKKKQSLDKKNEMIKSGKLIIKLYYIRKGEGKVTKANVVKETNCYYYLDKRGGYGSSNQIMKESVGWYYFETLEGLMKHIPEIVEFYLKKSEVNIKEAEKFFNILKKHNKEKLNKKV